MPRKSTKSVSKKPASTTRPFKRSLFPTDEDENISEVEDSNNQQQTEAKESPLYVIDLTGSASPIAPKQTKTTRSSSYKRGTLDAFASPTAVASKKQRTEAAAAAVVVTPQEKERKALAKYVPTYIHKTVDYQRRGTNADLSDTTRRVFDWIIKHYVVEEDVEQSRTYGPLSGSCFEERVIQAYSLNKLELRPDYNTGKNLKMCTVCAEEGHRRNSCPTLI